MKKARYRSGPAACKAISDAIAQRSKKNHSEGKIFNHVVHPRFAGTPTNAAETRCDMNYLKPNSKGHKAYQDLLRQKLQNPIHEPTFDPIWGTGEPVIDYYPEFHQLGPCMKEILIAHEEMHKMAAKGPCKALKSCVDEADKSWFGGIFGKTVSLNDYNNCLYSNAGGLPANCDADEQAAYTETVKKANQIKNEARCQSETVDIKRNMPFWTKAAKSYKC